MSHSKHLLCTLCGDANQIVKVSALYNSGLSTGNYTGKGYAGGAANGNIVMNFRGQNQTFLSQMLSPPIPPWEKYPVRSRGNGWIMIGFIGLIFSPCILTYAPPDSLTTVSRTEYSSIPPSALPALFVLAGVSLLLCCMIVYGIIINIRSARQRRRIIADETPRWQQAMYNWDCLYYCQRHDTVFNENAPHTYAPAIHMFNLL